ncbi:Pcf11p [Sporobolomyces koalae]|uniref:Pcf11p n=1 Tax=Sporobolomyces koalae TaxID=500713 RepID=UPI00317479FC
MSYPGYPPYDSQQAYNSYYHHPPHASAGPTPYYGYGAPPPPATPTGYPHYGQPRYDGYDYGAYGSYAPPPPHHAAPPPAAPLREGELRPPPDVGVDPNSFRRFFSQQLQALTFNSKPVITNLTLFAHEHVIRMSGVVAQCFEDHFRSVSPQYILPAFYLLDSISKNIGAPYLALFARFLERTFLSAYHSVDSATKVKLEELLGTWKTGGSDGGELFRMHDEPPTGARVQKGIETALFGATGRGGIGAGGKGRDAAESYNAGVQQLPHAATSGERSGVLYDVRRLLAQRQDQAAGNPEDQINQGQIIALKKLESLILNTQLTTEQVNQIRSQLAALNPRPAAGTSASPPPLRPTAIVPPPIAPPAPAPESATSLAQSTPIDPSRAMSPAAAVKSESSPSVVDGVDLSLLSRLSATGALANLFGSITPTPASPVVKSEGTPVPEVKPFVDAAAQQQHWDPADEAVQIWQDEIQRLHVELKNADLMHSRPNAASLLYTSIALQCQQCGLRFFDSKQGKAKMDLHLDWHFTYKRRIREGAARAQGRSWFTKEDDWYTSDNDLSSSFAVDHSASASSPTKGGSNTAASTNGAANTVDRAALMKKKVPVPPAGGLGDKPCPICQDKLKSEWSDEEEEWVWWNAVVVEGTLYHATCFAETTLARATAAASALARTNSALASREGTPVSTATNVLKRKVEEDAVATARDPAIKLEENGNQASTAIEGDDEREAKRIKSEPDENM